MLYDHDLIDQIKKMLVKSGKTLSVAESVTAGHLQAAFSSATEASEFFQGGISAYNAGQKTRHLDVEPIDALEHDSVTERVAAEMATGVNKLFLSDYGISITGYATPMPEKGINELYAYFAIAEKDEVIRAKKITSNKTDSVEAQIDYANQVIIEFSDFFE